MSFSQLLVAASTHRNLWIASYGMACNVCPFVLVRFFPGNRFYWQKVINESYLHSNLTWKIDYWHGITKHQHKPPHAYSLHHGCYRQVSLTLTVFKEISVKMFGQKLLYC